MPELTIPQFLLYAVGGLFLSYVWFRVVSLAVFTSWSQVCSYKCTICPYYNEAKEANNGKEKIEEQEEKEKIKEQGSQ